MDFPRILNSPGKHFSLRQRLAFMILSYRYKRALQNSLAWTVTEVEELSSEWQKRSSVEPRVSASRSALLAHIPSRWWIHNVWLIVPHASVSRAGLPEDSHGYTFIGPALSQSADLSGAFFGCVFLLPWLKRRKFSGTWEQGLLVRTRVFKPLVSKQLLYRVDCAP